MLILKNKEKLANQAGLVKNGVCAESGEARAGSGMLRIGALHSGKPFQVDSGRNDERVAHSMEDGGQSDTVESKKNKGNQGTVERITMHQKGNRMVVAMDEQEEPEGCASCGQKGVKTFQYSMCRACLAKKMRGIQDFIDEQRKEIFGER